MVTGSRLLVVCGLLRMCLVHAKCPAGNYWVNQHNNCGPMDDCPHKCLPCQGDTWSTGSAWSTCWACKAACSQTQYIHDDCEHTHDLVCASCLCQVNQYSTTSCVGSQGPGCTTCRDCDADQYTSQECNQGNNRGCSDCTPCAPWQYETASCSDSTDRVCTNHTACVVGQTYQTGGATATVDRICSNCTLCANGSMVN
jgi:hypothetical protein